MSLPSSRSPVQNGKPPAALLSPRERALQPKVAQAVLPPDHAGRGADPQAPGRERATDPQARRGRRRAGGHGQALRAGAQISFGAISRATGFGMPHVIATRAWAVSVGQWPYVLAKAGEGGP